MTSSIIDKWQQQVDEGKLAGLSKDKHRSELKFKKAYELSRKFSVDDTRRGDSAYYLGVATLANEKNNDAEKLLNESLEFVRKGQTDECMVRAFHIHNLLSVIYMQQKNYLAAESSAKEALHFSRGSSTASLEIKQILSAALLKQNKLEEALPFLEQILQDQYASDSSLISDTLFAIANILDKLGKTDDALKRRKEYLMVKEKQTGLGIKLKGPLLQVPHGWAEDRLSDFIETARTNQLATFVNERNIYQRLRAVDERFWSTRRNLPLLMMDQIADQYKVMDFEQIAFENAEWLEFFLFLRTHSTWLVATSVAMSGQGPESYTLFRGCLENALYAWYLHKNPKLKQCWLDRNESKTKKDAVKNHFRMSEIKACLKQGDSELGETVNHLYEETIDEGAHPNALTFYRNAVQKNADGTLVLSVTYLDPKQIDALLDCALKVGDAVLGVHRLIFGSLTD